MLTPTVPTINSGPELLVKASNLSHSSFEQILSFLKLEAIFAPTGYPLIIPIINGKAPSPRILKSGFIILFKHLPNELIKFVCINAFVATKKGKRDGTTEFAHNESPFFIAGKLLEEKRSRQIVKNKKTNAKKFLFKLNTKK